MQDEFIDYLDKEILFYEERYKHIDEDDCCCWANLQCLLRVKDKYLQLKAKNETT